MWPLGMTVFGFQQADGKQVERRGGAEPKQRFCLNGMMALSRGCLREDSGVRSISQITMFFRRLMAPAFQLIQPNPLWAWRGQKNPAKCFQHIFIKCTILVFKYILNKVFGVLFALRILLYCLYSV